MVEGRQSLPVLFYTIALSLDHGPHLWRQLSNATEPPAQHCLLIHHFTNQDSSVVMPTLRTLWYFFFVPRATSKPITVSHSYPSPPPPLCHLPPHLLLGLVCTQTQRDASCNHCWTQFQGQFEDYLLSLVNKKRMKNRVDKIFRKVSKKTNVWRFL